MAENLKFISLLDKYNLSHNLGSDTLVNIALKKLVFNPSDFEAYLLAFGDVPETYEKFVTIVEFVKNMQGEELVSLHRALQDLNKAGKTIFSQNCKD